jgi:hypothetical protein
MKRLLVIPLLLAVAACAGHVEFPSPPADKLVCPDEPAVPAAPVTDEANGEYLKGMRSSWAGCKSDVDWLRSWFRELND